MLLVFSLPFYKRPIARGSVWADRGQWWLSCAPPTFACSACAVTMATGGCMIERRHFRGRGNQTVFIGDEIHFVFPFKDPG